MIYSLLKKIKIAKGNRHYQSVCCDLSSLFRNWSLGRSLVISIWSLSDLKYNDFVKIRTRYTNFIMILLSFRIFLKSKKVKIAHISEILDKNWLQNSRIRAGYAAILTFLQFWLAFNVIETFLTYFKKNSGKIKQPLQNFHDQ